jgi:glycosyltransferase involved in cell wall biosynthesis
VTAAREADLVVSVKPVPGSFDIARAVAHRAERPLLLDIDDPDLEGLLAIGNPVRAVAKSILRARSYWGARDLRKYVWDYPRTVSNPTLQDWYGGDIVPHARPDTGVGASHVRVRPHVVFVGTNRPHKGLESLRRAVSALSSEGFTLTVTDVAPDDARPHERWVGTTTLQAGIDLVQASDIVVIPSVAKNLYSGGQLPVKIIDAMIAGRAVVASDLAPLRWALGEGGVTFRAGDLDDLTAKLRVLAEPSAREILGSAARIRALEMFTVEAVAEPFRLACEAALVGKPSSPYRGG